MRGKVEGILLSKIPYQEKNAIGQLLLRNGRKVSVLFYGGQSVSLKKARSPLDVGNMLKVEISGNSKNNTQSSGLYKSREWATSWGHQKIRYHYHAFLLTSFILEVLNYSSVEEMLHKGEMSSGHDLDGIFRVGSNALYYLNEYPETSEIFRHTAIFFGKLCQGLGVYPQLENCHFCEGPLSVENASEFFYEHGGFNCKSCSSHSDTLAPVLHRFLAVLAKSKYPELYAIELPRARELGQNLFNYYCYQFHLKQSDFRSAYSLWNDLAPS
jgi:DNA repair protein RecO